MFLHELILRFWAWLQARFTAWILAILSCGPIPQHVAFEMDGNRRYARKRGKKAQEGHYAGFDALRRALDICFKMNIRCVSVYSFAISNFNRPQEEVDTLMGLAESKLLEICQHEGLLTKHGVRLNVIGDKKLFPKNVQEAVQKAEELTRHNDKAIFNMLMPYDSHYEIDNAVRTAVIDVVKEGKPRHLTEKDIDDRMLTTIAGSPPLDILIRTSGVKRLSGFMLWQCSDDTQIQFTDTYWPDFGLRDLVPVVLDYQRKVWSRQKSRPPTL
ncbi:dehydrodolichyl diphosphate synthetase, partial [Coniophora puteana RWD-64-598 SS2]